MLYKSSRRGFSSARALLLLPLGAAFSGACVSEEAPIPTPPPEAVSASHPPPPISGGTLLVTSDKTTAVAADPDRDRVVIADLASKSVVGAIQLQPGEEPGRVIEGAPGRVHVALRRAGAIVTIDLAQKKLVNRAEVCAAPRGMAYENGVLHVACSGGELVTLNASSGAIVRELHLEDDLRDVVIQGTDLLVTRFRSAAILRVDAAGNVAETQKIQPMGDFTFGTEGAVAWRMVQLPTGGVGVVHQSATTDVVIPEQGGYEQPGPCGEGIVKSFVSIGQDGKGIPLTTGGVLRQSALPVDIAFSADGSRMAVVAAGSNTVFEGDTNAYRITNSEFGECEPNTPDPFDGGQPVAVAFADLTRVVQTREPARLVVGDGEIIELGGESVYDTGHSLFHSAATPTGSLACASCHPEGHEDGRVWNFINSGPRRTQSIAGGILATAPFHWAGDLDGFDSLMSDVFTGRMAGPELKPVEKLATARWIDSIPDPVISPVADAAAVERGKAIFNDANVACASCHSGLRMTNNQSVDVGTFGVMQVPSLRGLAARAPYMHDGCAPTLEDRFTNTSCGGGDQHGHTSQLSSGQVSDLVAYLKTL